MRSFAAVSAWLALLAVVAGDARAAEPADLDALVAVALDRHPEIAALDLDADSARARASVAGRPMDPQWMFGAQALGAMPEAVDPTMGMVGVQQMFSLPPMYTTARDRAELDERWAEGERARTAADIRQALWEAAARLRAQAAQARTLDEQLTAARAALAFGRARYGAGGASPAAMPSSGGAEPEPMPVSPPVVGRPAAGAGGIPGMSGPGAGMSRAQPSMGGMADARGMAEMPGGMGGSMAAPMGGEGLAGLLRLETEVARAEAERDAVAARRAGEFARLALAVGDEAADAVATDPARFLGDPEAASASPERALAALTVEIAAADVKVARAGRLPTFMVATGVQVMPEGMVNGVDAEVGVTVPLWGGAGARVDAAVAASEAAARRAELVDRGLAEALAVALADEAAALARSKALSDVALPRARAAWEATVAVWTAGTGDASDLVAAWQTLVGVARDAADAELTVELARARRARLEGR